MSSSLRLTFLTCVFACLSLILRGQDLPVFSQKLTDGFLMNPALTGASGGAIAFAYLNQWQSVENSPTTSYLSAHFLNKGDNLGFGVNSYFERANQLRTSQTTLSSGFHLPLTTRLRLSFGLGMELRFSRLDMDRLFVRDPDDPVLLSYDDEQSIDFTSGINISHPTFDAGLAVQRLTRLLDNKKETLFNAFITGHFNYYLPVRGGQDLLEPRVLIRHQHEGPTQLDVLLFYTIRKEFIVGLNYRTESIFGGSLGYIYKHRYILGYNVLSGVGEGGRDLGLMHEIVLRFNFNKQYFAHYNPELNEPRSSFTFKKRQR